jgi:hypothetical protein
MATAIIGIGAVQPAYQIPKVAVTKPATKVSTPQPKGDTVTISAQGKYAAQQHAPYSPIEEFYERDGEKLREKELGIK